MKKFDIINKTEDFKTQYKLYASGELRMISSSIVKYTKPNGSKVQYWKENPEIRLTWNQVREISIIYKKHLEIREEREISKWEQLKDWMKSKLSF